MRTTPLGLNLSGEGWHLRRPGGAGSLRVGFWSVGRATSLLFAVGAVAALATGRLLGASGLGALALAFAIVPTAYDGPPVPPRTWSDGARSGLLLPIQPMRPVVILVLAALATICLVTTAVLVVEVGRGRLLSMLAVVLLATMGIGLAIAAVGGLASRGASDAGLVLAPEGVLLTERARPRLVEWEEIAQIRPHWTRVVPLDTMSPDDAVTNWITFESPGRSAPSLDVEVLAIGAHAVLAIAQFYLAYPEARAELADERAVARLRRVETEIAG